jgi:hypothetical protein
VVIKERTLALFMLTQYYKVFTEVVKNIMNTIGCHKGPAVRELTRAGGMYGAPHPVHWSRWNVWRTAPSALGPVEYVENSIQCTGAGGMYGEQHPVHWSRWNIWRTASSALEPVECMENSIQCIGAGAICGEQHPVHWGRCNMCSTSYSSF